MEIISNNLPSLFRYCSFPPFVISFARCFSCSISESTYPLFSIVFSVFVFMYYLFLCLAKVVCNSPAASALTHPTFFTGTETKTTLYICFELILEVNTTFFFSPSPKTNIFIAWCNAGRCAASICSLFAIFEHVLSTLKWWCIRRTLAVDALCEWGAWVNLCLLFVLSKCYCSVSFNLI